MVQSCSRWSHDRRFSRLPFYDHVDHLLDEVAFAQRSHRNVQAYVQLLEQRQEQDDSVTVATSITVTWLRPNKGIIHAAHLLVDAITLAPDDPSVEHQITQLHERSRVARTLVYGALSARAIQADHNVLLTAGVREELMQLQTEQLLWEIVVSGEGSRVVERGDGDHPGISHHRLGRRHNVACAISYVWV